MKALLICPDQRAAVSFIRRQRPLALLPFFGRTLLDHWLEHLAVAGVKHVTILAADRPDEIRSHTDNGDCWGLKLTVLAVKEELTSERARALYINDDAAACHDGAHVRLNPHSSPELITSTYIPSIATSWKTYFVASGISGT